MPSTSILGGISQEVSQQELLANATYLLAAILEKMPRIDGAERLIVTHGESSVEVSTARSFGTLARPADAVPTQIAQAGAMHIYDNIKVS